MKKLNFAIEINAGRETVWSALWEDANYREWTSNFQEGSYAISEWKEGSKVQFLSPEGDGMYSVIDRLIPNEYMSFRHLGDIKAGIEQPQSEETKMWMGATENYTLEDVNGKTLLKVDMDITESHEHVFNKIFPRALEAVKQIAEASANK